MRDGIIIAAVITTHMPRNDAAAAGQDCPGIGIQAIATVQPPGIGIPPMADMEPHQTTVTVALAAKSSAETPKKACCEARSEAMREISDSRLSHVRVRGGLTLSVVIVTAPPDTRLVAPPGRPIEPLVHAPEAVQSACIGGIGVVHGPVLEHERAHAGPFARVRRHVGTGHGGDLGDRPSVALCQ